MVRGRLVPLGVGAGLGDYVDVTLVAQVVGVLAVAR
jgi:hypothetical protein